MGEKTHRDTPKPRGLNNAWVFEPQASSSCLLPDTQDQRNKVGRGEERLDDRCRGQHGGLKGLGRSPLLQGDALGMLAFEAQHAESGDPRLQLATALCSSTSPLLCFGAGLAARCHVL